jgi:nicotinate phosphoribosyltransferase
MPIYIAKLYDGVRQDSGNPYTFADKMINHYKNLGIDPMTKTIIFSDSLNMEKAIDLKKTFSDKIKVAFVLPLLRT